MAVLVAPEMWFLQGPATDVEATKLRTSAAAFRRMLDGTLGRTQGVQYTVNNPVDLYVKATGVVDGFVHVQPGQCYVRGTQAATQGMYHLYNDAILDINVLGPNPAHATLARIDLCVARFQDSFYSGASDLPTIEMVTGTPSGSPAVPAAPANSLILAQLSILAASSTIPQSVITDKRVPAGIQPVKLFDLTGAVASYDTNGGAAGGGATAGAFIPPGFRSLRMNYKLRDSSAANAVGVAQVRFNGIATATYDTQVLQGLGAAATAQEVIAGTAANLSLAAGGGLVNANVFAQGRCEIPGYADTTNEKSGIGVSTMSLGNNLTGTFYFTGHHFHARMMAAITQLQLIPSQGTGWTALSFLEIYGEP